MGSEISWLFIYSPQAVRGKSGRKVANANPQASKSSFSYGKGQEPGMFRSGESRSGNSRLDQIFPFCGDKRFC